MTNRRSTFAVFVVTGLALFMTSLDNLVVTTALPVIRVSLHAGLTGLEWTVNGYTLTFAVCLLAGAAYGDRFGRRRMFQIGMALFTLASAAAALAPDIGLLIAARAVQGIGGAVVVPLTLTILADEVPGPRRPVALVAWSAMSGLAIALGPVVGGAIVTSANWQWIFWINVPIGVLLLPLALLSVKESHGPANRLDIAGTTLATLALLGVVYGLVAVNDTGWTNPVTLAAFVVGAALFVVFLFWERQAPAPMLPLRLFAARGFAASNVTAMLLTVGMLGAVFLLAQFLQTVQGYSPLGAGLRMLPWTGAPLAVAPVAGVLAGRVGMRVLVSVGVALQVVAVVWLAVVVTPTVGYSLVVPALVLAGVGMGLFFALIAPLVLSFVATDDEGMASGVNNAMREFGVVLGVAVLAAVFAATGGYRSGAQFVDGLRAALWVGAGIVALAFVVSLLIPPLRRSMPRTVAAESTARDAAETMAG